MEVKSKYRNLKLRREFIEEVEQFLKRRGLRYTVPQFITNVVEKYIRSVDKKSSESTSKTPHLLLEINKKLDEIKDRLTGMQNSFYKMVEELEERINKLEDALLSQPNNYSAQNLGVEESEYSVENEQYQDIIEIQPNDPKPIEKMMLAFLGESKPVAYNSEGLGKVVVEYGIIRFPYERAKHLLDQDKKSEIEKEFDCSITIKVYDYDNYVVIMPKTSAGFGRGDADEKSKLKEWFKRNFRELMLSLIG